MLLIGVKIALVASSVCINRSQIPLVELTWVSLILFSLLASRLGLSGCRPEADPERPSGLQRYHDSLRADGIWQDFHHGRDDSGACQRRVIPL